MSSLSVQPVKGMRDIIGKPARLKRWVEATIGKTVAKYGFDPIQLPVLENLETLTLKGGGGDDVGKELYTLEDQSGRKLGLRYEHTTSLARMLAANPELPKPVKAFNLGNVYRYDNPQAFRYREFTQADCDIIGSTHASADAECVSIAVDAMTALGFAEFRIRINDRRIMNAMLSLCEVPATHAKDAMRIIDKLDKIGAEGVKAELEKHAIPTGILAYLAQPLPKIKKALEEANHDVAGVHALEKLFASLENMGHLSHTVFDLSLVRGLEYYTGSVFEIYAGLHVSVGGGGRYDELIRTLGGPQTPAVGISFGVDRLVDALSTTWNHPGTHAYIIPIGNTYPTAQLLARQLRDHGHATEIDIMGRSIG
ncbi:MAG: histidine--tRNA ligase, partial [archaeon]